MKFGKQAFPRLLAVLALGLSGLCFGTASASPFDPRPLVPPPIDKDLLAVTAAAPGYCESIGGSTSYEAISSVLVTENASGSYMLEIDVYISNPSGCVAGKPCPSYDPNPEQVNVWIDFNGDKQWDASEKVHDVALTGYGGINFYGTMTTVAQFTPPANVTAEPTWLRANLGWGSDPNDPCQYSWSWGNVVDKQVQFEAPKITQINVRGIEWNQQVLPPITGLDVELSAEIELPDGYEISKCSWSGDLKIGEGDKDDQCRYTYTPATGNGPAKQTYGEKTVELNLTYTHTASGATGQLSKKHQYKVFFNRDAWDTFVQAGPNWFTYWKDDGAIPELNATDVTFDLEAGPRSYGSWDPSTGNVALGPSAAKEHYPSGIVVPQNTLCPGGIFGGAKGIDSVAEVIAHERQHETFYGYWNGASAIWSGKTDTDDYTPEDKTNFDGDNLPDDYEDTPPKMDKTKADSCGLGIKGGAAYKSEVYKWYGDQELLCMIAGHGKTGIADKDWAYPGKKAETVKVALVEGSSVRPAFVPGGASAMGSTLGPKIQSKSAVKAATPGVFAALNGSYFSQGLDTDADGKYNRLELTVGLEVADDGFYSLVAWLQDPSGRDVAWANVQQDLLKGTQSLVLQFEGKVIYEAGYNGPYTISQIKLKVDDSEILVEAAQDVHTTQAFLATDFDPPYASLTGPYSDEGVDTNADGLFENLNVSVGLFIDKPGYYKVIGELDDGSGTPIDTASTAKTFVKGNTQVTLAYSGEAIFSSRQTGPYQLKRLRIEDQGGNRIAILDAPHQTKSYSYTDFQHAGLWLHVDPIQDQGLDFDGDGLFEYLRLSLPLAGNQPGVYLVSADLAVGESTTIASAEAQTPFTSGTQVVQLAFTGSAIRGSGLNGPYRIERLTILNETGEVTDYRALAHTTQTYQATQFSNPLVELAGDLSDFGTDTNGNGRYDLLTVRFGISVLKDGVVFINARLVDKNGKEIEWANNNVPMTAGTGQDIELNFSGQLIGANGVDGPFEIRDLNLYCSLDPGMNIFRDLAGTTSAYSSAAFEGGGGSFNDVPSSSWAFSYINAIRAENITQGCGNGNYCPKDPVTREQMAAFLVRAVEGDPVANYCGGVPPFNDVSPGAWSCGHIKRLVELEITQGCGGGNYCPLRKVTREQMAAFIVRAKEGDPAANYCGGVAPFVDVSPDSWSCGHVKRLVEMGITQGFPGGEYRPYADVNREQMAAFLARAFLGMK